MERVAPHLPVADALETFDRSLASERQHCVAMPGAIELLSTIEVPWAVVTSGSRQHASALLAAVRLPTPAVLVCGDEVKHGKPHPEGFMRAASLLRIAPGSCAAIEDAPAGIQAAKAAGSHPDRNRNDPPTSAARIRRNRIQISFRSSSIPGGTNPSSQMPGSPSRLTAETQPVDWGCPFT